MGAQPGEWNTSDMQINRIRQMRTGTISEWCRDARKYCMENNGEALKICNFNKRHDGRNKDMAKP